MNFPLKNWKPSGYCNSNDLLKLTTLLLTSGIEHAIERFANPSNRKAAMNTMYLAMALTLQCRFEGQNFLPRALLSLTVGRATGCFWGVIAVITAHSPLVIFNGS